MRHNVFLHFQRGAFERFEGPEALFKNGIVGNELAATAFFEVPDGPSEHLVVVAGVSYIADHPAGETAMLVRKVQCLDGETRLTWLHQTAVGPIDIRTQDGSIKITQAMDSALRRGFESLGVTQEGDQGVRRTPLGAVLVKGIHGRRDALVVPMAGDPKSAITGFKNPEQFSIMTLGEIHSRVAEFDDISRSLVVDHDVFGMAGE